MSALDPVALLFGGMAKLGPGSDADTRHVLHLLPSRSFRLVVDAGCGAGRQTLVLARELRTPIQALDTHEPFLDDLRRRAREARIDDLVHARRMDMKDIPRLFRDIDLIWSEGAAYSIGFSNALTIWRPALGAHGLTVVSELSWLREERPDEATRFFRAAYPDMRSVEENRSAAARAGYAVIATHTVSREAWIDGYYDVLAARAKDLRGHADASVRALAAGVVEEIEVFDRAEGSYGYVFYVLGCS